MFSLLKFFGIESTFTRNDFDVNYQNIVKFVLKIFKREFKVVL